MSTIGVSFQNCSMHIEALYLHLLMYICIHTNGPMYIFWSATWSFCFSCFGIYFSRWHKDLPRRSKHELSNPPLLPSLDSYNTYMYDSFLLWSVYSFISYCWLSFVSSVRMSCPRSRAELSSRTAGSHMWLFRLRLRLIKIK